MSRHSSENKQESEKSLRDTFIASFIIGAIILAMWLCIFFIYINRL